MKDPETGREMNNSKRRRNAKTLERMKARWAMEQQFGRTPGWYSTPNATALAGGTVMRELRLSP